MNLYEIQLRMGMLNPRQPSLNGTRQLLLWLNSKAINAIFCGVSIDEFHRISHVETTKEAWTILESTYEGTKKVKDTKL